MGNKIEEIEALIKERLESAKAAKLNLDLGGFPDTAYHRGQISVLEELLRRVGEIKDSE
jgi:hypothetical protein